MLGKGARLPLRVASGSNLASLMLGSTTFFVQLVSSYNGACKGTRICFCESREFFADAHFFIKIARYYRNGNRSHTLQKRHGSLPFYQVTLRAKSLKFRLDKNHRFRIFFFVFRSVSAQIDRSPRQTSFSFFASFPSSLSPS